MGIVWNPEIQFVDRVEFLIADVYSDAYSKSYILR
jgi:hypothetical protein